MIRSSLAFVLSATLHASLVLCALLQPQIVELEFAWRVALVVIATVQMVVAVLASRRAARSVVLGGLVVALAALLWLPLVNIWMAETEESKSIRFIEDAIGSLTSSKTLWLATVPAIEILLATAVGFLLGSLLRRSIGRIRGLTVRSL